MSDDTRRRDLARAESALRESEQLNQRILESVPGGVVVVSPVGAVLRANAEAMRILGLSFDQMHQRYVADFEPETIWEDGSHCPVEAYPVAKCLASGEPQGPVTIGVRQPGGEIAWAVFRAVPLSDPETGERLGAVVTFLDVTERKREEERRRQFETRIQETQRLESLGVLAGGIAHDFNNLLVGILGNTELAMLRLEEGGSDVQDLVRDARTAALRASELTSQLLAYSGEGRRAPGPLNLSEIVQEMVHLLQGTISRGVALRVELPDDLPGIEGDGSQVRQVVMNLITNAAEAVGDAGGSIDVRCGVVERTEAVERAIFSAAAPGSAAFVFFEVADDGCGMDAVAQARLFDPFFTTKPTGHGLGLAAVQGIVRRHQGALSVESAAGRGTRIRVFFPSLGRPVPVGRREATWTARSDSGLVLVVDDEEHVRLVVQRALEQFGYRVLTARNGSQGIDLYRDNVGDVGLVILDLLMDDMDGEDALLAMREVRGDVPVIISSGYRRDMTGSRLEGYAAVAFLEKPYSLEDLVGAVERALQPE